MKCTLSLNPCRVSGGAGRDRTDDLKLAKLPLSQLSYGPFRDATKNLLTGQTGLKSMVGLGRLELPTSRLSGVRSNRAELQAPETSKVPPA